MSSQLTSFEGKLDDRNTALIDKLHLEQTRLRSERNHARDLLKSANEQSRRVRAKAEALALAVAHALTCENDRMSYHHLEKALEEYGNGE